MTRIQNSRLTFKRELLSEDNPRRQVTNQSPITMHPSPTFKKTSQGTQKT